MASEVKVDVKIVDDREIRNVENRMKELEERLKEAKSLADDLAKEIGSMSVYISVKTEH